MNFGQAYEKSSSYRANASSSYLCILAIFSPYFSLNWLFTFSSMSFTWGHRERLIANNAYICSFFFRIWSNCGDFWWYCLVFKIYKRTLLNSRIASAYLSKRPTTDQSPDKHFELNRINPWTSRKIWQNLTTFEYDDRRQQLTLSFCLAGETSILKFVNFPL